MPVISVFMDVEDPLNPLADEAALEVASLFNEIQVKGSFCITGEKCRTLMARERADVIEAFRPHCLGLHTNTHSYHPTTMELLANTSFEEGCELALATERPGFDAFISAFGRSPVFWGGAGNTWSPEITEVLKSLSIPAYVYALTTVPHIEVHRFNGVLALPQSLSVSEVDFIQSTSRAEETLQSISMSKALWLGVFVGHPTRFRYNRFWDTSFANGLTPETPELSEPTPERDYRHGLENFKTFLIELKGSFEVIGVDEAIAMPRKFREPTLQEAAYFRERTSLAIQSAKHWPIHRPDLDVQNIIDKTLALESTLGITE